MNPTSAANPTISAVSGIEVGHYTDSANGTGCTVFLCREGAVGGVDVRGGSPGTRETDLLRPVHRVDQVHGLVFSGGSAFGLDAASGVAAYLEEEGIGIRLGSAIIPIVPAAILFDLGLITGEVRPGPQEGRLACLAASVSPMAEGSVGAGTGATIAKALGMAAAVKGGIGSAAMTLPDGTVVAAAVAVNAYGGVYDPQSGALVAGPRKDSGLGFNDPVELALGRDSGPSDSETGDAGSGRGALANTTLGVVATDARLSKEDANYLAAVSHDGLALTIRPCHTVRDGDTMFALATGKKTIEDVGGTANLTRLGAAAVEVTYQAVLRAVYSATGLGGVPALSELSRA